MVGDDVVGAAFLWRHTAPGFEIETVRVDRAGQATDEVHHASEALHARIDHRQHRRTTHGLVAAGQAQVLPAIAKRPPLAMKLGSGLTIRLSMACGVVAAGVAVDICTGWATRAGRCFGVVVGVRDAMRGGRDGVMDGAGSHCTRRASDGVGIVAVFGQRHADGAASSTTRKPRWSSSVAASVAMRDQRSRVSGCGVRPGICVGSIPLCGLVGHGLGE